MSRVLRLPKLLLVPLSVIWLAGCSVPNAVNPVAWYRDLTGASKNDDTANQPNQKNLAEGGKEPYPNLAEVPDAPENALSTIDRKKLEQSLIADRTNAKYTDQQLDAGKPIAGQDVPAAPPPAQAAPVAATPSAATAAAGPAPAPSAAPAQAPPKVAASAPATPAPAMAPSSPPPAVTPPHAPAPAAAAPPPAAAAAAAAAVTPPVAAPPRRQVAVLPPRGSEAPPQESPLITPSIPNVPTGETPPPPPAPPNMPPTPVPEASAPPAAPVAAKPPAPPRLAAVPQKPKQVAAAGSGLRRPPPSLSYEVGEVKFASGSSAVGAPQRGALGEIVKLHQADGGKIRVVGYAERPANGDAAAEVNTFTLALERAKEVAEALAQAGVPADQIAIEAAPSRPGISEIPRAEIYFEQ